MLLWTIQTAIFSIIFILLVHHIILFFKNTLTVPKIKDLVNAPTRKYENIIQTMSENKSEEYSEDYSYKKIEKPDLHSMKNELKNFFKNKLNETETTTEISTIETAQNYSLY
jgi:hypothetical protein